MARAGWPGVFSDHAAPDQAVLQAAHAQQVHEDVSEISAQSPNTMFLRRGARVNPLAFEPIFGIGR
jgi:hypothetical protein